MTNVDEKSQTMVSNLGEDREKVDDDDSDVVTDLATHQDECTCKEHLDEAVMISCDSCEQWYHVKCVKLEGLTQEMVEKINEYECPFCIVSVAKLTPPINHPILNVNTKMPNIATVTANGDSRTMQLIIKEELNLITPVIRATVQDVVKQALPSEICTKEEVKEMIEESADKAVKTYSSVTAVTQKKVIDEMSLIQASKTVVNEVSRKMDTDKVERENRKLNLCILDVPESTRTDAKHRQGDDYKFCVETLKINKKDIDSCHRAGKLDSSKSDYRRPLIVKMVDKECVDYYSNNGKGFKTDSKHWINKDLCKSDREANFLARRERRKRWESAKTEQVLEE